MLMISASKWLPFACLGESLTDHSGLEIHEHSTGNMLASSSLAEEGVEGVVTTTDGLVRGHLAIRLNTMLQAVELPAGIADLDSGLTDVDGDTLTLRRNKVRSGC